MMKRSFGIVGFGGPSSIFVKHLSTDKLIKDLILLHVRLADFGMDYHKGQVYLADLDDFP